MIRKISAHYIFPVISPPVKLGIIVTDNSGTIHEIIDPGKGNIEKEKVEFYNGILVPGFISIQDSFIVTKNIIRFQDLALYSELELSDKYIAIRPTDTDGLKDKETIKLLPKLKTFILTNSPTQGLELIKSLAENTPADFNTLLSLATLQCARVTECLDTFGSFGKGKKPGISLITSFDYKKMTVTPNSKIKVLV